MPCYSDSYEVLLLRLPLVTLRPAYHTSPFCVVLPMRYLSELRYLKWPTIEDCALAYLRENTGGHMHFQVASLRWRRSIRGMQVSSRLSRARRRINFPTPTRSNLQWCSAGHNRRSVNSVSSVPPAHVMGARCSNTRTCTCICMKSTLTGEHWSEGEQGRGGRSCYEEGTVRRTESVEFPVIDAFPVTSR